jgi:hypothetical protein
MKRAVNSEGFIDVIDGMIDVVRPTLEYQALSADGKMVACIFIQDGKCEEYSIVPEIIGTCGEEEGLLFLLNWMTSRAKGPIISKLYSKLLHEYGFEYSKGQFVF